MIQTLQHEHENKAARRARAIAGCRSVWEGAVPKFLACSHHAVASCRSPGHGDGNGALSS